MPQKKIKLQTIEVFEEIGPHIFIERKRNLVSSVQGILVDIERPLLQRIGHDTSNKACNDAFIWTIAGHDVTNSEGEVTVSLSEKLPCHTQGQEFIGGDPYFVATAISNEPALLTATIETTIIPNLNENGHWVPLEAPGLEARVKVASWDTNGERIGGVEFNWICVARLTQWVYGYEPVPPK